VLEAELRDVVGDALLGHQRVAVDDDGPFEFHGALTLGADGNGGQHVGDIGILQLEELDVLRRDVRCIIRLAGAGRDDYETLAERRLANGGGDGGGCIFG